MEETRIQKWKAYRASLIKQEAQIEEDQNSFRNIEVKTKEELRQTISATSTLPYEEVIKGIEQEEPKVNIWPLVIKYGAIVLCCLIVVTGLVFLGFWAFGGK